MLRRNRVFWMDVVCVLMIPIDFYLGGRAFLDGHAPIAAMYMTAGLMLVWGGRHIADFALTAFCMWYLKRSMVKHFNVVMKLKQEADNESNQDR